MTKINKRKILKLVINNIAEIFPYLFIFYLVFFILSLFFESWRLFFNWTAFHISMFCLFLVSLFSDLVRKIIFSPKNLKELDKLKKQLRAINQERYNYQSIARGETKTDLEKLKEQTGFMGGILVRYYILVNFFAKVKLVVVFSLSFVKDVTLSVLRFTKRFVIQTVKSLGLKDYLKIFLILVILIFILIKGYSVLNSLIIAYLLASILFTLDSRVALGIFFILLVQIPFLLLGQKLVLVEILAIYAYYFLAIAVIVQFKDYLRKGE